MIHVRRIGKYVENMGSWPNQIPALSFASIHRQKLLKL